jgi:hypothetical protein
MPGTAEPPGRLRRRAVAFAAAAVACLVIGAGIARLWPDTTTSANLSRVVTGPSASRVSVEGAELTVAANTQLTVSEDDAGEVQLVLERGRVDCSVAPREDRAPFRVWAADVQVQVVGTRFSVSREEAGVEVSVEHGTVRVLHAGDVTLVGAGQRWPRLPAARTESAQEPETGGDPDDAAEPEVEMDPVVVDSSRRSGSPARTTDELASRSNRAGQAERDRYETAARLESTRPDEAIAIYRGLVAKDGVWASNALFAQARLRLARGQRAAGRRLLERYLHRYPAGANATLARKLLDESR